MDGTADVANPYTYVHNSPLNGTDPTGERCTDGKCFDLARFPQSVDVPICLPSPGWPAVRCEDITVPTPNLPTANDIANADIDQIETAGRLRARLDFRLSGSPSPLSDQVGARLAMEQVRQNPEGGGTRIWACREGDSGSSLALSWKYKLKVWCVAPAYLMPPAADGLTIGHFVFCRYEAGCHMGSADHILEHEFWHVDQFETFGDLFGVAYGAESARVAATGQEASGCANRYERPAYVNGSADGRCS